MSKWARKTPLTLAYSVPDRVHGNGEVVCVSLHNSFGICLPCESVDETDLFW